MESTYTLITLLFIADASTAHSQKEMHRSEYQPQIFVHEGPAPVFSLAPLCVITPGAISAGRIY